MRSDFEMLPFVALMLDDNFIFVEQSNEYTHKNHTEHRVTLGYLNGAWLTYQNRQNEVDELQKRVDEQGLVIAKIMSIASDLQKNWEMFEVGKKLEQALKGGSTLNLNTDENGECRHFSTTMFHKGKAECFHCEAVVNENREVIGKQSKGLHPFFKKEQK